MDERGLERAVPLFVFAHNNELTIADFLASLAAALTKNPVLASEAVVYVLANGCRDRTVAVAKQAISELPLATKAHVEEIERGGKANAWNHAAHTVLPRHSTADVAIFLDSDVDLSETDLGALVALLRERPNVLATTSKPSKRPIPFQLGKLVPYLSSRSSSGHKNGVICGQLYAMRVDWAQRIWMPRGLLVEDGFLAGCLRTRFFSGEPDDGLIVAHPSTYHYFEVEQSLGGAIRHEERTELGSHMNFVAYPLLWETEDAEAFLKAHYDADPDWLVRRFEHELSSRGRGVFRWNRCLASFRELKLDAKLPIRGVMACLRALQRGIALERAYRRATAGDLRW